MPIVVPKASAREKLPLPILIGQAPSKFSSENRASRPFRGYSGYRIAGLIGLSLERLHTLVEARNLFDQFPGRAKSKGDNFDSIAAKANAERMRPSLAGRTVILFGAKVVEAFGLSLRPLESINAEDGTVFVAIPHPSGINLWWNSVKNVEAAKKLLRRIILERKTP